MKKQGNIQIALIVMIISLMAGAAGCSPAPTQVPPTETLSPSNTPVPTSTLMPTNTVIPSPTPDLQATSNAQSTQVAEDQLAAIRTDLDLVGYPESGHLAWYQTKPVSITPSVNQMFFDELIDESLNASDFIFKTDITWNATSLVYCGFNFRADANIAKGKHYEFLFMRFSGLPAWDIEYHDAGEFVKNVTDKVRFSDQIVIDNNATNKFILVAKGNVFTVYINGVRQGDFYDFGNSLTQGTFAFTALQDSGTSSCKFDNSWIWVY
jgi:hypothetical protein